MRKITLTDIKQALKDGRFRDLLPLTFRDDIVQFLGNPNCACNVPLYRKIVKECKEQLKSYFPDKEVVDESEEIQKLAQNHWTVINCHISELENKLKNLPSGRKQLAISRYEDNCTVIINDLELIY